jgi:FkbM family methyltransferase
MKKKILKTFRKAVKPFLQIEGIGNFYPVKLGYKFLINLFNPIEIQGSKMFISPRDGLGLLITPIHEEFETELFKREVKRGDVVLDLGAHIGYYTLLAAKIVGEKGKVYAFEPDPGNYGLLKKNIEANGYKNVIAVQKAISNKTEKGRLFLRGDGVSRRLYDANHKYSSIETETVKLDDYFKDYDGKINFIKMDIEGSEGNAVKGIIGLLKRNGALKMIMEFRPENIRESGADPLETLETLIGFGFKLYNLNSDKRSLELVSEPKSICGDEIKTYLFCVKP